MSLLVVGSVALDTLETPHGEAPDVLGGSATFFSLAARLFTPVRLVGVVGEDFPPSYRKVLESRGIDLVGLETVKGGKTFRWTGRYEGDMNEATTLEVHLNVFGNFWPKLPEAWRKTPWVFLANGAPHTQASVLDAVEKPKFVMMDTMNLWIQTAREPLDDLLKRVDGVSMNEQEAKLFAEVDNLIKAGRIIQEHGPKVVLIKKASHGAILFTNSSIRALPAYPLEEIRDPTGAGDSFAGGFMGSLAESGDVNDASLGHALSYAVALASFTVEDFGTAPLLDLTREQVEQRRAFLQKMVAI